VGRAAILLLALVALLVGAERLLAGRERARHAGDPAVERLVAPDRSAGAKVSAISVALGDAQLLYVRKHGLWRSREAHGAVCSEAEVRGLLSAFFDARGVRRAAGATDAAAYGFDPERRLGVSFHGGRVLEDPGRDVLFSFEVGRANSGRAFVREGGSGGILEIDRDPRRLLELPLGALLPPLVDTRLLAGCLDEGFRGFREFRIERPGGASFRVAAGEAEKESGEPAPWTLDRGNGREAFPGWRVGGYMGLWLRGRFEETRSPSQAAELGLDPPAAIAKVTPDGCTPFEVWISAADDRHKAYVWMKPTNVIAVVPERWQPQLAPDAEMFLDEKRPNPWEEWLRKP